MFVAGQDINNEGIRFCWTGMLARWDSWTPIHEYIHSFSVETQQENTQSYIKLFTIRSLGYLKPLGGVFFLLSAILFHYIQDKADPADMSKTEL